MKRSQAQANDFQASDLSSLHPRMPRNTKKRRRKHRGSQTGSVKRTRSRPRNRQEAMSQAKSGGKGARPDRRDVKPTWNSATKRGLLFALLLFPISLLFGQTIGSAIVLTVIAAIFYVPLGFYTETFFYNRRQARKVKEQAEAEAEKASTKKDD